MLMIVLAMLVTEVTEPRTVAQAVDQEQERAIAAIEKFGGKVERDESVAGRPVASVVIAFPDLAIKYLVAFPKLRTVVARFGHLSDDDLKHLEALTTLERLDLSYNQITDIESTSARSPRGARIF